MGLADGLAAVTGTLWGKKSEYRILGAKKSWVGSATFLMTALVITIGYSLLSGHQLPWFIYALLPVVATMLESVGLWGVDNVTVPIFVILTLSLL